MNAILRKSTAAAGAAATRLSGGVVAASASRQLRCCASMTDSYSDACRKTSYHEGMTWKQRWGSKLFWRSFVALGVFYLVVGQNNRETQTLLSGMKNGNMPKVEALMLREDDRVAELTLLKQQAAEAKEAREKKENE